MKLTARSRKRIRNRLAREWFDCVNNITSLESEHEFELRNECFAKAAGLFRELMAGRHRLAEIENRIKSF